MTIAFKSLEIMPDGQHQIVHQMATSTGEPNGIVFLEQPLSFATQAEQYRDEMARSTRRLEIEAHPVNEFLSSLGLPLIKWLRYQA